MEGWLYFDDQLEMQMALQRPLTYCLQWYLQLLYCPSPLVGLLSWTNTSQWYGRFSSIWRNDPSPLLLWLSFPFPLASFPCHSCCPLLCHLFLSPFLCHHQQGWCPWHLDLLCVRWLPHTRLMASRPALLADRTPPLHAQTDTWQGFQCVWKGVVSGRLAPQ